MKKISFKDNNMNSSNGFKNISASIPNTNLLQFDFMKLAYLANGLEEEQDTIEAETKDAHLDAIHLELAKIWVEAYSKATGQHNPGRIAFEGAVTKLEFNKAMEIARNMKGKSREDVAERITVEFGHGNPLATEVIMYFLNNPAIGTMFQFDTVEATDEKHIAEHVKDEILENNSSESIAQMKAQFEAQEQGVQPIQEELKEEENKQAKVESKIPKLAMEDFSPKQMFEYADKVDFDGENLYVFGPDGEVKIEENPDPKLVKVATLNRIWKTTCINMLGPDAEPEWIEEAKANMFVGDNQILLKRISQLLLEDKITSVDTIIREMAKVEGVENSSAFIHKTFDFISNLAQFGDMDFDFTGVQQRKAYIDLARENDAPQMEFNRK